MENTKKLMERIEHGGLDGRLKEIYVDESLLPIQWERYKKAIEKYEELYGMGEVEIYSAPGRSEVGGNHTDHQRGEVLAAAINMDAIAIVGKTEDHKIQLLSEGYPMTTIDLETKGLDKNEIGTSKALMRGVADWLREKKYQIGGFQAYVTSDVLGGSGLSSSAAFEVLIGNILSGLYNDMKITPIEIAQAAQFAENVYFGKPCGLMDQMASSVGGLIHIDFKDGNNPLIEPVDVDFSAYGHSLCITDTKGSHADLTDEYAAVPKEMCSVAAVFGKEVLREVEKENFYKKLPALRNQLGDRPVLRAMHFYEENERVEQQVQSLQEGKFNEFLQLVKKSGNSSFNYLQNVYTNKDVQNQAVSIGLAVSERVLENHGVSRVHGGGFAGTIQAFVEDEFVDTYKKTLDEVFGEGSCEVLKVRPFGGAKVL